MIQHLLCWYHGRSPHVGIVIHGPAVFKGMQHRMLVGCYSKHQQLFSPFISITHFAPWGARICLVWDSWRFVCDKLCSSVTECSVNKQVISARLYFTHVYLPPNALSWAAGKEPELTIIHWSNTGNLVTFPHFLLLIRLRHKERQSKSYSVFATLAALCLRIVSNHLAHSSPPK